MKRESWSIAVACFLGAFIGAFVALDIVARFEYNSYFVSTVALGIGVLLGGAIAYVAVDFRQSLAGVRHAYRDVINWHPDRIYWKAFLAMSVGFCVMCITVLSIVLGGPLLLDHQEYLLHPVFIWVMSVSIVTLALTLPSTVLSRPTDMSDEDYAKRMEELRKEGVRVILWTNPIGILYWMVVKLVWVARHTPHAVAVSVSFAYHGIVDFVGMMARFIARIFVYIHSERRMLCFVDAALGVAVGFYFGNALIGAVAGTLFGVINYEVVSVRWLKLVPQRAG